MLADEVCSTEKMVTFCRESPAREIIVVTEAGLLHRLRKEIPGKTFIPGPTDNCFCGECRFMKMNTLGESVRRAVEHGTGDHFARIGAQTRGSTDSAHARAEQIENLPTNSRDCLGLSTVRQTRKRSGESHELKRISPCWTTAGRLLFRYRMTAKEESIEERIDRLHAGGIVDIHFDLLIDLYEKRDRTNVLESQFLPEFETGNMGVLGVAIYVEDRYLPESGLRVALDQVARLYAETRAYHRFAICKSVCEIENARAEDKIALIITMEGVEPLATI